VNYEEFFISQLPLIEKVITQVCRRNHLREAEREEFASEVKLHMIDRDYDVLRRFQQRSSMHTYLTVVVQRVFLNYRNRVWGRWRPTAEALRLGPTAILLERLVVRDGWPFEEAQEQIRTNHGVERSRDELHELWLKIMPASSPRRIVSESLASDVPSRGDAADVHIVRAERDFRDRRVRLALQAACQSLTAEERLLIKMRYDDGFRVSEIAATLHRKQKPLYRTFDDIMSQLRASLVAAGISPEDIHELFDDRSGGDDEDTPARNDGDDPDDGGTQGGGSHGGGAAAVSQRAVRKPLKPGPGSVVSFRREGAGG